MSHSAFNLADIVQFISLPLEFVGLFLTIVEVFYILEK